MDIVARDRTARTRIRNYLVAHGPVSDPSGHATSVLSDLVSYEGSAVAFIQLIAAMDRDDEIVREIRGKRTYRISASRAAQLAVGPRPAPADPLAVPLEQAVAESSGALRIDYNKLAHALVRQLSGDTIGAPAGPTRAAGESRAEIEADIAALRAERDRMIKERDEYARRLQSARVQLDELLGVSEPEGRQAGITA